MDLGQDDLGQGTGWLPKVVFNKGEKYPTEVSRGSFVEGRQQSTYGSCHGPCNSYDSETLTYFNVVVKGSSAEWSDLLPNDDLYLHHH